MPDYTKPTIARKVKDHQLQRIPDKTTQLFNVQNVVHQHVHTRKTERYEGGFELTRRTGYFAKKEIEKNERHQDMERAKQSQTQMIDGIPVGDIKAVTVKTANKTIRVMRQEANAKRSKRDNNSTNPADDDSDEQALETMLTDIISRTLTHKLNKQDPEFKVFKEHPERGIGYFNERFAYIPDELVVDIFLTIQD